MDRQRHGEMIQISNCFKLASVILPLLERLFGRILTPPCWFSFVWQIFVFLILAEPILLKYKHLPICTRFGVFTK